MRNCDVYENLTDISSCLVFLVIVVVVVVVDTASDEPVWNLYETENTGANKETEGTPDRDCKRRNELSFNIELYL